MIKVLDSFIADKIAAGEVIERPVSIVKELIENSIDAGAKTIYVEIKNGGKSYIRVTDDGCGIPEDELSTAFLRHATSKISSISDLDHIESLGFRGEALASIAAVSRLTVVSRTAISKTGSKLVLHGGKEISREIVGSNVGTTFIIEDVFYNTPARRKFMSNEAREASAIIELLEQYAIYYADIKIALVNNGKTIFTTSGDGNNFNAITNIYPTHDYKNLILVKSIHLSGYISNPGITRSSKRGQLFFVNGRLIKSSLIEKAIEKGYGDRLFSGYPIAILFLKIDPSTIDVNIHPGKREINFLDKNSISNEIIDAIHMALNLEKSIPSANTEKLQLKEDFNIEYSSTLKNSKENLRNTINEPIEKPIEIKDYLENLNRDSQETSDQNDNFSNNISENTDKPFDFKNLKFKGYIFNTYIIMQEDDTIYIFDQHAAHERIYYEKFMAYYSNDDHKSQTILNPITINVAPSIYSADREWMAVLHTMGFSISDFGPNTFVIREIPQLMNVSEAHNFAQAFIEDIGSFRDNKIVIDKLIMKSCKAAVKANNTLSSLEINDLMTELSKCNNPFSCPHGRPTFIKATKYQIEKSFNRK